MWKYSKGGGATNSSGQDALKLIRLVFLFSLIGTAVANAHGTEDGFVLLLPSRHYILGAAIAVAASFLLLALLPQRLALRMARTDGVRLFRLPGLSAWPFSLLSLCLFAVLIAAGLYGSRDPMRNPLPLFLWVDWWIAFTLLQALTGSLWNLFNPWSGLVRLFGWLSRGRLSANGLVRLPRQIGYAIAIVQFFGFAWYELVDIAPYDPTGLAYAALLFWGFNLAGMLIFGEGEWRRRAEPFSIYFHLIGAVAPLQTLKDKTGGGRWLHLVWPGLKMARRPPMSVSGSLFVLLTLATISFDGLSHTFTWAGIIGINPLEYPGRSAVVWQSSFGMLGVFAVLAALFYGCVWIGLMLAESDIPLGYAAGRLIYGIVPISLAFHAAHYLTFLMVQGQYGLIAFSDPFGLGWNLFGTATDQVTTSFFFDYDSVLAIWNTQTVAIVIGHVIGIAIAHVIAVDLLRENGKAVRSQIALAAFMVLYTAFGLWLLATPTMG